MVKFYPEYTYYVVSIKVNPLSQVAHIDWLVSYKNVFLKVGDDKILVTNQIKSIKSGFLRTSIKEGVNMFSINYLIETGTHLWVRRKYSSQYLSFLYFILF